MELHVALSDLMYAIDSESGFVDYRYPSMNSLHTGMPAIKLSRANGVQGATLS